MKKLSIILLISITCCELVFAQSKIRADRNYELKIGQLLPQFPKFPIMNYPKSEILLQDHHNKVVILDFFDTYCSNCIASMPKLQQLQESLADQLQIIMVTWQDRETIDNFFANNNFLKKHNVKLPTVYADTLLRKYFPHNGLPHTAWLYNGLVQAVTFSDFVKLENIKKLYTNGRIQLPVKSDFNDGLVVMHPNSDSNFIGRTEITGYRDAVQSRGVKIEYDSIQDILKSNIYNMDVLGAYTSVWSKIQKPRFLLRDERIVWNVRDSSKYHFVKGNVTKKEWLLQHAICYERDDKFRKTEKEQAKIILNDLNNFLGLNVYWSTRDLPTLILKKIGSRQTQVESVVDGLEGSGVLAFMIDYQQKFAPVIDEANVGFPIKIEEFRTIKEINENLLPYGLALEEGIRSLEVLVLEEVR